MAPGGKVITMLVSASTSVADVYTYVEDKEGQRDFELTYKQAQWGKDESRVVGLVDDYVTAVRVVGKLRGGARKKKKKKVKKVKKVKRAPATKEPGNCIGVCSPDVAADWPPSIAPGIGDVLFKITDSFTGEDILRL